MRWILAVLMFFVAASVSAQETYSQNATANQVVDLRAALTADNETICEAKGLLETCTQAQVCVAANVAGGASCTAAQARAAKVRIYPDTQAGRDEYVLHGLVSPAFTGAKARAAARAQIKLCRFWATANTTQKNSVCSAAGLPNGCELCE